MTLESSLADNPSLTYAVVYQGQYPPGQLSAGVRRVRDICRGLAAAGGNVTMFVPGHFGPSPGSEGDFHVREVGMVQKKPTYSSRWRFWSAVSESVSELQPDFTLFYDTSLDSIRCMRRLKSRGFRIGFELCDFHSTYQISPLKKIAYSVSERILPKQSDLTIVITHHIERWVKSVAASSQVLIIPGLFDTTKFKRNELAAEMFRRQNGVAADEVLITYAGSWWKPKGVAELVEAFAVAKTRTEMSLRLAIAGKYTGTAELEDDIREVVHSRGLSESVILPGFLNSDEMVGLLSASDVVVSPSLNHPFNQAAFPTKVAEYAGIGCPILATAVGDIPLYFQDGKNAVLCNAENPDSMADGIVRLAEDPEFRVRIGLAAAKTAKEYFDFRTCGIRIDKEVRSLFSTRKCA